VNTLPKTVVQKQKGIMSGNEAWKERKCFQASTECRQRRRRDHVVRQTVANCRSGDWEGPAADGRQRIAGQFAYLYCSTWIESSHARVVGGSVAEWLACWTQAQKAGSNRSRDAVG